MVVRELEPGGLLDARPQRAAVHELHGDERPPVVFVDLDGAAAYPAGIEFLGRLLGREERAAAEGAGRDGWRRRSGR